MTEQYRCRACLSKDPEHACPFKGVPGRDPDVPLGPPLPRTPDSELLSFEELLKHPDTGPEMRRMGLDKPEPPFWRQVQEMAAEMPPDERAILTDVLDRVEEEYRAERRGRS